MTVEERLEVAIKLQNHHYFFREFWDIGVPILGKTEEISTAAITFDKKGESLNLVIDEDFWKSLNDDTKTFLICHEMMHIILYHGKRFLEYFGTSDAQTFNIAADVVINEMLVKSFNFDRSLLNDELKIKGCWIDSIFPDGNVKPEQSAEYYFNLLKNNSSNPNYSIPEHFQLDEHKIMSDEELQSLKKYIEDSYALDSLDKDLSDLLKDHSLDECPLAGSMSQRESFEVNSKTVRKKKWESVIKNWENESIKDSEYTYTERWERVNPLYSQLMTGNIHLPTNCNILDESPSKNKISVFFFLDTSGSCIRLKDRFFSAAKSLNPRKFDIRLFCFDTYVYETTIVSNRVYGGGGTSFTIMEDCIKKIISDEKTVYPKAVFVITDGFGDSIHPVHPDRWYWFLTEHSSQHYIPTNSKKFLLSEFE